MTEKIKYPSWRYHATETARIVQTQEESDELGSGWCDSPADVDTPAPVVTISDGETEEMPELEVKDTIDVMGKGAVCAGIRELDGHVDGRKSVETLRAELRALIEDGDGDSS